MWTILYVSQSLETAKKLSDTLLNNDIASKMRRARGTDADTCDCYEVLVPNTELSAAQDLLIENELF